MTGVDVIKALVLGALVAGCASWGASDSGQLTGSSLAVEGRGAQPPASPAVANADDDCPKAEATVSTRYVAQGTGQAPRVDTSPMTNLGGSTTTGLVPTGSGPARTESRGKPRKPGC